VFFAGEDNGEPGCIDATSQTVVHDEKRKASTRFRFDDGSPSSLAAFTACTGAKKKIVE
jgi:hypothetical protein